jgi:hypothetical protein
MNLAQQDGSHFPRADCPEKFLSIGHDAIAAVPFGEPEIQDIPCRFLAVSHLFEFAGSAASRAESVNQPTEA